MGVGWTVELELNRKKEKKMDSNAGGGGCDPLDPPRGGAGSCCAPMFLSGLYLNFCKCPRHRED